MCRTSVRPGKTKSDNLNLFYGIIDCGDNTSKLMLIHSDFSVDLDKIMEKCVRSAKTRRTDFGKF